MRGIIVFGFASALMTAGPAVAQPAASAGDMRRLHEQVVYTTVQILTSDGGVGTGWLLAQTGRPLVVTNRHVAEHVGPGGTRVRFYAGAERPPVEVGATRMHISAHIDLGILQLEADPPPTARALALSTDVTVVRGERVVLGGNPADPGNRAVLPFQTTEGVVTGHISGPAFQPCGVGRNCVVVDAASFSGSSGGPAFSVSGQLVGMLWGGPVQAAHMQMGMAAVTSQGQVVATVGQSRAAMQNPSFGYLIHVRTIADELRSLEAGTTRPTADRPRRPTLPLLPPRASVTAALAGAREPVAACGPGGEVQVTITFLGATGEVGRVRIETPDVRPHVADCIGNAIRAQRVPPFYRSDLLVTYRYRLGGPPSETP